MFIALHLFLLLIRIQLSFGENDWYVMNGKITEAQLKVIYYYRQMNLSDKFPWGKEHLTKIWV